MLTARAPQCSRCNRLLPWPDVERGDKACSTCPDKVEPIPVPKPVDPLCQLLLRARAVSEETLPVVAHQIRLAVVREVEAYHAAHPWIVPTHEAITAYVGSVKAELAELEGKEPADG